MSVSFTEEQEDLRRLVRRFCTEQSPSKEIRRVLESGQGWDRGLWSRLAAQLGLQGVAIPAEYGGAGGGPVELGIVLEELGRALLVSPYLSSVALAGQALTSSADEAAKARWLPGIADGSLIATLAVAEETGSWDPAAVRTTAEPAGTGWTLRGTKMFVTDGTTAGLVLVVARAADGPGLFAVESGAGGMRTTKLDAVDLTRELARVDLDAAPATRIGTAADSAAHLETLRDLVLVAIAAEQIGGAARCLEMAVDYAKIRVQFERPIGSFQAIKHKCADLLVEVESGRSASYYALGVAPGPEAAIASALAKTYCSGAYTHAAKENIQIHGGIGFTWEHDAHLYLKRAKSDEILFGSPAHHRSRLATLAGI
ncbi:acyl-CoA dehydrogenase family protein [Amycolatopsis sp.]|uniref:acyl-CoA dehydrogenase family protein n=1 Tax=Amycolatopsis sp. TaxID=37632 RepID=UPI002BA68B5F|nr:acyl-CoA dehydrogenase family protein [Amycolatopsis sp.]HVV10502.1 acyl-CoA dehydrogenase family protein [Amycolatopsis sp.]